MESEEETSFPCGSNVRKCHGNEENLKFKRVSSQCFAALAANTVMFTIGNLYGFMTILLAELYKKDAEIKCSTSDLSWLGSYLLLTPVGSIVVGMIAQYWGSKKCMMIATLSHSIAWLIFYHATSVPMLLVASGTAGFFIATCPSVTYIAEISESHLRSVILSTTTFSMTLGSLVTVSLGAFIHWRTITLINLMTAVAGFFMLSSIPDSPYWLASKGRFCEAEQELAWLRGWTALENVKPELQSLKQAFSNQETTPKDAVLTNKDRIKSFIEVYFDRSFYMPLIALSYMSVIRNFSGSIVIKYFGGVIFQIINTPYRELMIALIYVFRMIGTIAYVCCVRSFGKRKLACITLGVAGVSLLIAGSSIILEKHDQTNSAVFVLISVGLILITNFAVCAGYEPIVSDLNGELFPSKYRNIGAGIGYFTHTVLTTIVSKSSLPLVDLIKLEGIFFVFSISSIIGAFTFYFVIPVTEGKSLIEIENHYKRNLKCNEILVLSPESCKPFLETSESITEKPQEE